MSNTQIRAYTKTKTPSQIIEQYTTSGLSHHLHSSKTREPVSVSGRPTPVPRMQGNARLSHGRAPTVSEQNPFFYTLQLGAV